MCFLKEAAQRNFGGLPTNGFFNYLDPYNTAHTWQSARDLTVAEMVHKNIEITDPMASRHLMMICKSTSHSTYEAAVDMIRSATFRLPGRKWQQFIGSNFGRDLNTSGSSSQATGANYAQDVLSRIVACIEGGFIIVLRGLECVYGSLYNVLNQNYETSPDLSKRYTRVAMADAYKRTEVHPDFRCIVLVDETAARALDV